MPSARTRLFLLLGDPVAHSLSPEFQNAALRALGFDAVYLALRVDGEAVAAVMRAVGRAGGGGNVTLPHKARAAAALDDATPAVRATGSCNTFWWRDGHGLCGDNTDVEGFRGAAESLLAGPLAGRRVLLLGAGGAARSVAFACLDAGVAALDVFNRAPERARALIAALGAPPNAQATGEIGDLAGRSYDLVVNATPLGLAPGDVLPLDLRRGATAAAVLDLVYGSEDTPWVREARRLGLPAADGREMLVRQGAASFRRWWGVDPPLDVLRAAVGLG